MGIKFPRTTKKMKFLFLTVALVHCALASQETGALDGDNQESSQIEVRFPGLPSAVQHCSNLAAAMETLKNNPDMLVELADLTAGLKEDVCGLESKDGAWWDQEIKLVLKSDDEEEKSSEFTLTRKAAKKMNFLKKSIMGDETALEFSVEKHMVQSSEALRYAVDYVTGLGDRKPKDIQKPIRSVNIVECIADEDRADAENMLALFADGEGKRAVFDVILAANYLDIKSLLHLGCVQIATQIKGKSPAEIRAILGDDLNEDLQDTVTGMTRRRLLEAMSKAL